MRDNGVERTIEENLKTEKRIQIARNCMKRLAKLLGREPDSVKIKENASCIDFNRNDTQLSIPRISHHEKIALSVWQDANKIMFSGLDDAAKELCMAGYEDPESAIAACCARRKCIVFVLESNGKIQADYMSDCSSIINCGRECNCLAKLEFDSADEIAEFIYGPVEERL